MKKSTTLISKGRKPSDQYGFVNPPVYRGSTVLFPSVEEMRKPTQPYTYGRQGTPTQSALTDLMCELENGTVCKLTPSGLSAISCALLSYVEVGDHILVADSVYFPTRHFCDQTLRAMGVKTSYYDPLIGNGIGELITPATKLIFTESPGSNTFEVQDVSAIAEVAKQHDLFVLNDNTWATPLFYKPLDHGVDVSIHSATKYITGHSDALLGTITANERAAPQLMACHRALGLCPGTEETYAGLKGLRTLHVRLQQHMETALQLAQHLADWEEVAEVLHPALPSFAGHAIWCRDFSGSSGLFSIILRPCSEQALATFLNGLELFGMGWSWGGYESLIVPVNLAGARTATTPRFEGPLLRLHAGLEDITDLIADLEAGRKRMRDSRP